MLALPMRVRKVKLPRIDIPCVAVGWGAAGVFVFALIFMRYTFLFLK